MLDELGIGHANLVGMSMGGAVAQLVALARPDRVSTLTLVSTSPAVPADTERKLPQMAQEDLDESSGRLSDLRVPTLVVHGDEDPVFPLARGEALVAAVVHHTGSPSDWLR